MKRRSGFSMVELVITLTILGVLGSSIGLVLKKTQDGFLTAAAALELEVSGRTAIERLRELLRPAALGTLAPRLVTPLSSSRIEFQRDLTGSGAWGDLECIEWRMMPGELDDGLDNDSNGLVDEGQIVWVERVGRPDERVHVIVSRVTEMLRGEEAGGGDENQNGLQDESGLCFTFVGETMRIRISLERLDHNGQRLTSMVEAMLHIRN